MLKTAMHSKRHRISATVDPMRHAADQIVLSHPLVEGQAREVAVRLATTYGSEALRLANKRADEVFELEDAHKFFDWCLIIAALSELEEIGDSGKRRQY